MLLVDVVATGVRSTMLTTSHNLKFLLPTDDDQLMEGMWWQIG
jgi:hypothetical protein